MVSVAHSDHKSAIPLDSIGSQRRGCTNTLNGTIVLRQVAVQRHTRAPPIGLKPIHWMDFEANAEHNRRGNLFHPTAMCKGET